MAAFLATILDNRFKIFGFRFGFSAIIDLIPVVGDFIDVFLALYIVWIAIQMHIPYIKIIQMIWNIAICLIIGLLPIVGDTAYLFYKPNMRNLAIIKGSIAL